MTTDDKFRPVEVMEGGAEDSFAPPLSADYVIVGSGLTGATIARMLADDGREVIVL